MIEYRPWSKKILDECNIGEREGKIPALDLELSAKCSGACCLYCDSKPLVCEKAQEGETTFEDLKKFLLDCKKLGLKWVYTCGLGEPLEDKNFWDMLTLLKENNICLSMFSNGIFIDSLEKAKRLKECNVHIILKMDTFNGENFDKILGKPNASEKIYKARDYLIEAGYGKGDDGCTDLAFSIVPTKLSIDGIPEVIEYADKHGIFASIGELELAGNAKKDSIVDLLSIDAEKTAWLKNYVDDYYQCNYARPICPCILAGLHIDNLGNCIVDKLTGANCKWFLMKDPASYNIGNIRDNSVEELHKRVQEYRKEAIKTRLEDIKKACDITCEFGGCGSKPQTVLGLACDIYSDCIEKD